MCNNSTRRSTFRGALLWALIPLLSTRLAMAQDQASIEMARKRFNEGIAAYDRQDFEAARLAFLETYKLKPHPAVLLNLAQSELQTDRAADAANHFSQYLRDPDGKEASVAQDGLREAKAKVGELGISVDAEGASVFVNGEEIGSSPLPDPHYVEPGTYEVSASKGDLSVARQVSVALGKSASVKLELKKESAPAPPPTNQADLSQTKSESAAVGVDSTADTFGGRKGFGTWFVETPLAWVGAGVAAAGLTSSLVLALKSSSRYDAADATAQQISNAFQEDLAAGRIPNGASACGPPVDQLADYGGRPRGYSTACARYLDQNDSGDNLKRWSIITLVVGVAAGGGTVAYYFLDPNAKLSRESALRIAPVTTGGAYGVSVHGRF